MTDISIIVPIYNVERYLEKCVQSLINQTYTDIEIILVDDGSPDDCPKMCDEFCKKDSRIRVIHKQNGGLSDARNVGIDAAVGEYITFVDSDDYVKPTYVEYLMSLFEYCKSAKITACNHYVVRGGKLSRNAVTDDVFVYDKKQALKKVLYHDKIDVSACMKMYHRSVFSGLRYPVGRLYEDTYVFGDLLDTTDFVVYGGQPQYYYVQRDKSIVNGGFKQSRLHFITAVLKLVKTASVYPELHRACIRRITHARLSVLRYMDGCDEKYRAVRRHLRKKALSQAGRVLFDPLAPLADKLALVSLLFGIRPFFIAWKIYSKGRLI